MERRKRELPALRAREAQRMGGVLSIAPGGGAPGAAAITLATSLGNGTKARKKAKRRGKKRGKKPDKARRAIGQTVADQ